MPDFLRARDELGALYGRVVDAMGDDYSAHRVSRLVSVVYEGIVEEVTGVWKRERKAINDSDEAPRL